MVCIPGFWDGQSDPDWDKAITKDKRMNDLFLIFSM